MRGSRLRDKLAGGGTVVNAMVPFYSPNVVELLAAAGVDAVMIDGEHGAIDAQQAEQMVRAADAFDLPALVRVPHNDEPSILRYLDLGASGIIAPHVTTVEDARRAVRAAKYGPSGNRSYGSPRASIGRGSAADYVDLANRETLVIGLFEDVAGADQLDEIFAVEGLDALAVGPNDLAFSMGLGPNPWHPEVQKVVDRVIEASRRAGKATGLPAGDLEQARAHAGRGCRLISVGAGGLLTSAARALVRGLVD